MSAIQLRVWEEWARADELAANGDLENAAWVAANADRIEDEYLNKRRWSDHDFEQRVALRQDRYMRS